MPDKKVTFTPHVMELMQKKAKERREKKRETLKKEKRIIRRDSQYK